MGAARRGYDERLKSGRAVPLRPTSDLEDEPSMMVQEQIARIKFFDSRCKISGTRVLDLGCGSGFDCEYLKKKLDAAAVLGIDISRSAIEFARKVYPGIDFINGDLCDDSLDLGESGWDIVVCAEVIEHVERPAELLSAIHRYLRPGGSAFISTPNRPVFSLDRQPSPVNHTHLREYDVREYKELLSGRFREIKIYGQRFIDPRLFRMQQAIVARNIMDLRILGELYWNDLIRKAWKTFRMEPLIRLIGGGLTYTHRDFEFVEPISQDSIWLCAVVTK